ncbi:sulfite exporter TauE/SafE family protein [Candidatus Woesearchaeota archaeon]|nr:sulfite exporter TauE/SafE family protein [Candidatus Woesearchaeota archaeon]
MWLEIAVGALCGFLVGTSGLGGPMLFFPLLVTLFRVPAGDAVAISLAFNAIIRTESLAQHWKEVDWRSAGWLLLGGIPAGIAMVLYVHALHADLLREAAFDRTVSIAVGILLLFFGMVQLLNGLLPARSTPREKGAAWQGIAAGAFCGMVFAATSVGAGFVALALTLLFSLGSLQAVATQLLVSAVLTGVPGLIYIVAGTVHLSTLVPFLLGGVPAVALGSRVSHHVKESLLSVIVALVILTGGALLLYSVFW